MHTTQKATCGLCTSEFSERTDLHKHIKSQHPSSQWYACDVCDYVTLTRTSIIMHMHTHNNPKTYMCTVCKFTSLHINIMREHMECHNEGSFQEITRHPENTPLILLRCSECGYTTNKKETLKSHMWEHLRKNFPDNVKGKTLEEVVKPQVSELKSPAGPTHTYKCSDCSYVCNDSVTFITHMLSQHKPKQPQVDTIAANINQKTEDKSSYTHDVAGGFYRCTVCGYTSEHQRTIKSHMWRHSGTSSIDYPMFQNGPLSIYENTPIGLPQKIATKSVEIVKSVANAYPGGLKENVVEELPEKPKLGLGISRASVITSGHITLQRSTPKNITHNSPSPVETVSILQGTKAPHVTDAKDVVSNSPALKPSVPMPQSMVDIPTTTTVVPSVTKKALQDNVESNNGAQFYIVNSDGTQTPVRKERFSQETCVQVENEVAAEEVVIDTSGEEVVITTQEQDKTKSDIVKPSLEELDLRASCESNRQVSKRYDEQDNDDNETPFEVVVSREDNMVAADIPVAAQCTVISSQDETINDSDSEFSRQTYTSDSGSSTSSPTSGKKKFVLDSRVDDIINLPEGEAGRVSSEIIELLLKAKEQGRTLKKEDVSLATAFFHQLGIPHIPQQLLGKQKIDQMETGEHETGKRHAEDDVDEIKFNVKIPKLANVLVENVSTSYPTVELVSSENNSRANSPRHQAASSGHSSVTGSPVLDREKPDFSTSTSGMRSVDHTDEAITLLSLLKKGPNINPACPQPNVASSPKVASRPKSGISSSLLAVIEHLRERAKSESDGEDHITQSSLSSGKKSGKKGRKRSKKNLIYDDDGISMEEFHQVETVQKGMNSQYRCKLCHYTSNSPAFMKAHVKMTHKPKKPFECSLCDYIAESTGELQKHTLQHCKARVYQCKSCMATFGYKSQLRAHMRIHTELSSLSSGENNMISSGSSKVRPEKSRKYYCPDCQEGFASKAHYTEHISKCSKARTYFVCQVCGYKALNESQFIDHAKAKHMSQEMKHKCEFCDFHSTSQLEVSEHQNNHIKEQSLVCGMCGFTAISVRSLKSHMKRHANDKRFVQQPLEQYKCNLCGYLCHHLPSLKSHMWRHSSDTNYSYEMTNEVINAAMERDLMTEEQKQAVKSIAEGAAHGITKRTPIQNLITFRCCQCGFETGDKKSLNSHMTEHTDIIQRTQEINRARIMGSSDRTEENE